MTTITTTLTALTTPAVPTSPASVSTLIDHLGGRGVTDLLALIPEEIHA